MALDEVTQSVSTEGKQSLAPQNMPLWDIDHFKLIISKKQTQEKNKTKQNKPLTFFLTA